MSASPESPQGARTNPPGDLVQSVSRALTILQRISAESEPLSAREIASRAGLKVPTAYHLLNTLVFSGFLEKRGLTYIVSVDRVLELYANIKGPAPDPAALEAMRWLAAETEETVYLARRTGCDVAIVAVAEGARAVRVANLYVGLRGWEHARASGKLLLAYAPRSIVEEYLARGPLEALTENTIVDAIQFKRELVEIRRTGVALDREEYAAEVTCLAALVPQYENRNAALVVAMPKSRYRAAGTSNKKKLLIAIDRTTRP